MFIKLDDNNETVINSEHLVYFAASEVAGYSGKPDDRVAAIRFVFNGGVIIDARYEDEEKRDAEIDWFKMRVNA